MAREWNWYSLAFMNCEGYKGYEKFNFGGYSFTIAEITDMSTDTVTEL